MERRGSNLNLAWTSLLTVSLLIFLALGISSRKDIVLQPGDRLLVADFVNETGDPETGSRLRDLLCLFLDYSNHFVVFSDDETRDFLRHISRDPRTTVTAGLALEVCAGEKIPAFLLPRIGRAGRSLVMDFSLVEVRNNRIVREILIDTIRGKDEGDILASLEDFSLRFRRLVGEPYPSASLGGSILPQYSASNKDALRLFSQALVLDAERNYDSELALLREVVGLAPKFSLARRRLAGLLGRFRQDADALEQIQLAIATADGVPAKEMYRIRGEYHAAMGRYEDALKDYEALVSLYPRDWRAHADLAEIALRRSDYRFAAREYGKAAGLNPATAEPQLGLCLASLYNADMAEARPALEKAQSLAPEDPDVMHAGAMVDIVDNNLGSALRTLDRAVTHQVGRVKVSSLRLLAQTQIYGGRFSTAEAALASGIAESAAMGDAGLEAEFRLTKARLHLLRGEFPAGEEECAKGIALNPSPQLLAELGSVYAQLGRPQEARDILSRLERKLAPGECTEGVMLLRGDIAAASGRLDAALESFRKAKELSPNRRPSEPLAYALWKSGQAEEAAAEYQALAGRKAESLFPQDRPWFTGTWVRALFDAGSCLAALDRKSEAQQSFRNYLWVLDGADPTIATVQEAKAFIKGRGSEKKTSRRAVHGGIGHGRTR